MERKSYTYSIVLTPAEEGCYTVTVPVLPEAITEGDTAEEVLANARECIELCIECRIEEGMEIPQEIAPISTSIIVASPSYHPQRTAELYPGCYRKRARASLSGVFAGPTGPSGGWAEHAQIAPPDGNA